MPQPQAEELLPVLDCLTRATAVPGRFDGSTVFGWAKENGAKWRIADGSLIRVAGESGWLRHHATFNDFILKADFKTAAGPIALQAHDPTTNLDFKNIKVRSLR